MTQVSYWGLPITVFLIPDYSHVSFCIIIFITTSYCFLMLICGLLFIYFLGHCHGCEDYQPVVHPSRQAYGGGSSTFIDLPGSDGDSTDSD
jgi:hypothetical protein